MKKRFSILFFSILFCLMFSSMAFAIEYPEDVTGLPQQINNQDVVQYIIYHRSSNGYDFAWLVTKEVDFKVTSSTGNLNMYTKSGVKEDVPGAKYVRGPGETTFKKETVYTTSVFSDAFTSLGTLSQNTILYSSTDVINASDGTVFFQVPPKMEELYQTIQKVTEQGLETELTLAGTIRILVLCGVGLIALLMALNLFGKLFNRFRN